jgi:hypothetical protein
MELDLVQEPQPQALLRDRRCGQRNVSCSRQPLWLEQWRSQRPQSQTGVGGAPSSGR